MDPSGYEYFSFRNTRAINVARGVPERSFPSHRHSFGEIIVAGKGSKNIYRINDTLYTLTEGDIILVWPMELHEIVDADRSDSIVIQYSNVFADALFDFKRIITLYHGLHIVCINSHRKLAEKLISIAQRIRKTWDDGKPNREMRCSILLMKFMLVLEEHHKELEKDIRNDGGKTISEETLFSLMSVTDYIKNNLTSDDLSQTAMAERAGISRDYFSRIFKEVTGSNYNRWLNAVRVEKAVSLLPEEGLSLTEIAMLSGFKSIPSFNRVFAQFKNAPPSVYRRMIKENTITEDE